MSTVFRSVLAVSAFAAQALAFCEYGTSLRPRAEGGEVPIGQFAYIGVKGPTNWLSLDTAANTLCATGKNQSPIDMTAGTFATVKGSDLAFNISNIEATEFENLGVTVEVVADGAGTINVPDKGVFNLKQFHFHLPSEHLDNGSSSAMEMHMVWENDAKAVTVVGVYIDVDTTTAASTTNGAVTETTRTGTGASTGSANTAANAAASAAASAAANLVALLGGLNGNRRVNNKIRKARVKRAGQAKAATGITNVVNNVLTNVDKIATPGTATEVGPLDMAELVTLLQAADFQSYTGSLTTPPCTEGVNWFVSNQKLSVPLATFSKVRDVVGFNARFPQNTLGQDNLLAVSEKAIQGNAAAAAAAGAK